jgi:hypothetical protein
MILEYTDRGSFSGKAPAVLICSRYHQSAGNRGECREWGIEMLMRVCVPEILTFTVLLVFAFPASSDVYSYGDFTDIDVLVGNSYAMYDPVDFRLLHSGLPGIGVTCELFSPEEYWFNLYGSNGDGTFMDLEDYIYLPDYAFYNLCGDLNGDGYDDLFTGTTLYPWRNIIRLAIPGGLSDPYSFTAPSQTRIWGACDMDGDSPPDLYGTSQGSVVVWYGTASGPFNVVEVFSGLSAVHASAADLDLDGDHDIVISSSTSELHVLRNDGSLVFTNIDSHGPVPGADLRTSLSDLDGDGTPDIVAGCQPNSGEEAFHTYLNDGFGYFDYGASSLTDMDNSFFSAQDLDMDGFADLAVLFDWDLDIYGGDGAGAFQTDPTLFSMANVSPVSVVFDDYDCDGDPDMGCVVNNIAEFYLRSYWNTSYSQGCEGGIQFPDGFSLAVSSNPFRNGVTITVSDGVCPIHLDVIDLAGHLVTRITPGSEGMFFWDGTTFGGEQAPAGMYIVHAEIPGSAAVLRIAKLE